jgi:uncharacterized protein
VPHLADNKDVQRLAALTFLALGAAAVPALADFAAGLAAYDHHDYATAFKEWKPVAEAGDPEAQFNLGLLYYDGLGIPQSYSDAVLWFKRSADQGYEKAELNLGAMYGVGKGVHKNLIESYKWLSICAATGDAKCAAERDLVAKKLNSKKLAEAQRMAKEWKAQKESGQAP